MFRTAAESTVRTLTRCLRCGRPLRSAESIASGYGPTCRAKIRRAANVVDLAGWKADRIAAATELIEDGGIVPLRGTRIFLAVSTDGSSVHRTAVSGQCTCPAGLKGIRCYHVAAARIYATAA